MLAVPSYLGNIRLSMSELSKAQYVRYRITLPLTRRGFRFAYSFKREGLPRAIGLKRLNPRCSNDVSDDNTLGGLIWNLSICLIECAHETAKTSIHTVINLCVRLIVTDIFALNIVRWNVRELLYQNSTNHILSIPRNKRILWKKLLCRMQLFIYNTLLHLCRKII